MPKPTQPRPAAAPPGRGGSHAGERDPTHDSQPEDLKESASRVQALARGLGATTIETHVSWVLLCDTVAYKIKKPVRLAFLDYSTAQLRRRYCEEEVRLNARMAPGLYLGVSLVTGTSQAPEIDGAGAALDYAVRMRRFPPGALFSEQLAAGTLSRDAIDRFASMVAQTHRGSAKWLGPFDPDATRIRALAALSGARALTGPADAHDLNDWINEHGASLRAIRQARWGSGHVREGHGDLHLDNVVSIGHDVAAFDCIEFDPSLRCVDIVDDACFALMDFAARGAAPLGWRFFNAWLDQVGGHEGLALLRFGLVYRALVRTQVQLLRGCGGAAGRYVRCALGFARSRNACLVVMHGLPGSGKTFQSQALLEARGAIRIRTDVERKRLFGLGPLDRSAGRGLELYTPEASRMTYSHVLDMAAHALDAGWPTVIDGCFLRRSERDEALALARRMGVPFAIMACEAPTRVLKQRLADRHDDASEADAQVLDRMTGELEPLSRDELALVVRPCAGVEEGPDGPARAQDR